MSVLYYQLLCGGLFMFAILATLGWTIFKFRLEELQEELTITKEIRDHFRDKLKLHGIDPYTDNFKGKDELAAKTRRMLDERTPTGTHETLSDGSGLAWTKPSNQERYDKDEINPIDRKNRPA